MLKQDWLMRSQSENERKTSDKRGKIVGSCGIFLLLLCLGLLTPHGRKITAKLTSSDTVSQQLETQILPLVAESASRTNSLKKLLAESSTKLSSQDKARVHYLLATDLLDRNQGKAALEYLTELEASYPLLAPYILLLRGKAYKQTQETTKLADLKQEIMANYPNHPIIPDVLALGKLNSPQNFTLLQEQFPYHPLTQSLIRQKLQENPRQWQLLLSLVRYSRESNLVASRDRLFLQYASKLTKEDWEALASGYWRDGENRKAADAYALSPPTPQNLYRTARGFHLNGNFDSAKRAYQRLIREYHDAQETGWALIYIAKLSSADEAIAYLDIAIEKFPEQIPEALLAKAKIYDRFDKPEAAKEARDKVLDRYKQLPVSLEYRWKMAENAANRGDFVTAWQWGEAIAKHSQDAKHIFWVGKWAQQLEKEREAKKAFERVLTIAPQSYYAWRSAVLLGWDVGDFTSLRPLNPNLNLAINQEALPTGSQTLQELYLLGQYDLAWIQFQSEIQNPQNLTVAEQFTESVLLIKLGKIRSGIQGIIDLSQKEYSQEREQWQALRQSETYWSSLFPFPYQDSILNYSQQETINPLLVLSVMRKESTFESDIGSRVGAVGLMQVIPRTAQWVASQANITDYTLAQPEDNIKIGTWYLAYNHKRYQDNSLFAIASYNAGTGNVNQWLKKYNTNDLDIFVEQIPFQETKDYVEGVFGNYWNYLRLYNPEIQKLMEQVDR